MDIEEWIVLTNLLVALTSILAAAASEHDAIKTMGKTMISAMHLSAGRAQEKGDNKEGKGNAV